ncbi:MAG TPA: vitamin K epoxide reductase family protein [Solirubrobacteraceae bacterium]|nr:vitamin K epoxide reductase family protein [Solirubrobacteraceae bacterium]
MSDRRLRLAAFVLTLAGIGVAAYLTYIHYAGLQPFCAGGSHGCERVQSSSYASVGGLPVALLGLAGYVAIAVALVAPGERARLAATALAVSGFGFSAYLTYLELFVIDAICQWCVASAVILTLLTVVTVWRLLVDDDPIAYARDGVEQ